MGNILNKEVDYETLISILNCLCGYETYIVEIISSHDGKEYDSSIEVFERTPDGIIWFNDWYEGQPFCKMSYVFNVVDAYDTMMHIEQGDM